MFLIAVTFKSRYVSSVLLSLIEVWPNTRYETNKEITSLDINNKDPPHFCVIHSFFSVLFFIVLYLL